MMRFPGSFWTCVVLFVVLQTAIAVVAPIRDATAQEATCAVGTPCPARNAVAALDAVSAALRIPSIALAFGAAFVGGRTVLQERRTRAEAQAGTQSGGEQVRAAGPSAGELAATRAQPRPFQEAMPPLPPDAGMVVMRR